MKEYSTACEFDRGSSRRIGGLSIKKLLAEEMSKETEPRRRYPSVVAKLMGLDGLPSQQPIHKQQKTSNGKTIYGIAEIRRSPRECRSYMKNSRENPEFKDVYEVSEKKVSVKSKRYDAEMNYIRHNFMDAKQLPTDSKFHNSEEICDTQDSLETNKGHLIKFLQQPDSLYKKHLNDMQGASPVYRCSHMQPVSENYENKTIVLKSKKRTSRRNCIYQREHLSSFSPNFRSPCNSITSAKSSEFPLERKHDIEILPTRIIVLKPNLEKLQKAKKHVSSHQRRVEYQSNSSEGAGQLGVKLLPADLGFSRPNTRKSREKAKVITRRMHKSQGYAGDESSYNVSGSDSGSELENMLSLRKSFHWNNPRNAMSVSTEAKKRLLKRFQVSQRYLNVESVGHISKIGEMLVAKPNREMRHDKFDPKLFPDMYRDAIMDLDTSLDINCRYDWNNRYARNVSRSGFISDSSVICFSPETSTGCRKHNQRRRLILKELADQERIRETNENIIGREGSRIRRSNIENKKVHSRYHSADCDDVVEKDKFDINVGQNISSEEVSLVSKMHGVNDHGPCLMTEDKVGVDYESKHFSCGSTDEFSAKPSPCLSGINNSSVTCLKNSEQQTEPSEEDLVLLQCPVPDIQTQLSSQEADHLSPISVLEAPLTEDLSSGSECFEKVSADLQELRMQLKLLRMESIDGNNFSFGNNQRSFPEMDKNTPLDYATWQTSYINDVITESGFDSTDTNMIVAIWHSLESPISPWVLDNLEKKYNKDKSRSKSDRKLLFDRINCGLVEIFWWLVDPYPWVETGRKKLSHVCGVKAVQNELEKLLAIEEEQVLDKEMEWFDFGDEIDVIGREIENLLVNELVHEAANMYAF